MKLEICANSYQSAVNAQEAGAHRIELCSELSVGGITPSSGLLKQVLDAVDIPVFVLIRPRSGNFCYSDSEFEQMKTNIKTSKVLGCKGIVSGVLNSDNTIDIERTKELIQLAKPLPFTFHRAFDCVPNPYLAVVQLVELRVQRVLTSGQESAAEIGLDLLKELHASAKEELLILPGSGINSNNASLFKNAGFQEIHASATKPIENTNNSKFFNDTVQLESDVQTIVSILKQIQ